MLPKSRKFFFPSIPPPPGVPASATDPTNQKGDESKLAGVGDPIEHRSKAEQIEQQAWEFTNTIQRFGMRVVVGGRGSGHQGNGEVGKKGGKDDDSDVDEEEQEAVRDEIEGKELSPKQKRKLKAKLAREKRDAAVGKMAKAAQDGLGDFADALERIAKCVVLPYTLHLPSLMVIPRQRTLAAKVLPAQRGARQDRRRNLCPNPPGLCRRSGPPVGSDCIVRHRNRLLRPANPHPRCETLRRRCAGLAGED